MSLLKKQLIATLVVSLVIITSLSTAALAQLPDIIAENITTNPGLPELGTRAELIATIANNSGLSIGSFVVRYEVDGAIIVDIRVTGLSPFQRGTLATNWDVEPGDHVVRVLVDFEEEINEFNENNNSAQLLLSLPRPGLAATIELDNINAFAQAFEESNTAFQIPFNSDIFALVEDVKRAFLEASRAFSASTNNISATLSTVPEHLQSGAAFASLQALQQLSGQISSTLNRAGGGPTDFSLTSMRSALVTLKSHMTALSQIAVNGIDFGRFQDSPAIIDQLIRNLDIISDALGGQGAFPTGPAMQFINQLESLGRLWFLLSGEMRFYARSNAPAHFDESGAPLENYNSGSTLQIVLQGNPQLTFELYSPDGTLVATQESSGSELLWNGLLESGDSPSPGTYFYRLTLTNPDGSIRVELVQLIID